MADPVETVEFVEVVDISDDGVCFGRKTIRGITYNHVAAFTYAPHLVFTYDVDPCM